MWSILICVVLLVAFGSIGIPVLIAGLPTAYFFCKNTLYSNYLMLTQKVFCRHCKRQLHLCFLHDHPCLVAPECPNCGMSLIPESDLCPKCKNPVGAYLDSCFLDNPVANGSPRQLSDEELRKHFPRTNDRMTDHWKHN